MECFLYVYGGLMGTDRLSKTLQQNNATLICLAQAFEFAAFLAIQFIPSTKMEW